MEGGRKEIVNGCHEWGRCADGLRGKRVPYAGAEAGTIHAVGRMRGRPTRVRGMSRRRGSEIPGGIGLVLYVVRR